MGFLDFLVDDPGSKSGIKGKGGPVRVPRDDSPDARGWLSRFWGVRGPSQYACGTCGYGGGTECKCDPKLGRPRKWYE